MPVTATVTAIQSNVLGGTGSVPLDDKARPAAGLTATGAPLYYDATHAGGDPDWTGVWDNVKRISPGQPRRVVTQVLLTAHGIDNSSVCTWELFNLPVKAAGNTRGPGEPAMAVTAFVKPTNTQVIRGVRPGRQLLAVGVDPAHPTQYHPVPQYQNYPAPVFRRLNGPRVVVDLPIPDADEQVQYLVDLLVPGAIAVPVSVSAIQVAVDADGNVVVNSPPETNPFPPPSEDYTYTVPGAGDANTIAELTALGYSGAAWTPGTYLVAGNGQRYHWTGSAWATGATPADPLEITSTVPGGAAAANITALRALPYRHAVWTLGQYLVAANDSKYYWKGDDWATGAAPAPNVLDISSTVPGGPTAVDITALRALPYRHAVWTEGQYLIAGDKAKYSWAGDDWATGAAPIPNPLDLTSTVTGAATAADITALRALTYAHAAWTAGQYLIAGDKAKYHWTGTDWATGVTPG